MNELELKSCPFCASDEVTVGTDDGLKFVRCDGCDAGWALAEDDVRDPAALWNHRVSADTDAGAAELKKQLHAIRLVLNAADDDNLALAAEAVMVHRRFLASVLIGYDSIPVAAFESPQLIKDYYDAVDFALYIIEREPRPFNSRIELGEELIRWAAYEPSVLRSDGTQSSICIHCRMTGEGLGKIAHAESCLHLRAKEMMRYLRNT